MVPSIDSLIADLQDRLQLAPQPWNDQGNLRSQSVLSLIAGIDKIQGVSPASDFRWRDCEPLLQQGSALLDRALADRTAFQSIGEKYATFSVDILRSTKLIEIMKEEATQRFSTPYLVSKSQYESQNALLANLNGQLDPASNRMQAVKSLKDNAPLQSDRLYLQGFLSRYPLAHGDGNPLYPNLPGDQQFGHVSSDIDRDDRKVRIDEMQAQVVALTGQRDALAISVKGAKAQQDWDEANEDFMQRRLDLETTVLALKLSMAQVEWLLDFGQQISSIAPRYQQTLRDANDRMIAINDGMAKVYGRVYPDGKLIDPLPVLDDEPSVDAIVAWARRQATWLAALTRTSHNYVLPISVRSLCADWDGGKAAKQWTFSLPQIKFDQQCYVRLRGIAGWVVGSDDSSLWTLDVQLPEKATFLYEKGLTNELSQGLIKCRISGVTSRARRLTTDISGTASCYNACPIGDNWSVKISDAFNPGAAAALDDIQLDLYLAVLPF